MGKIIAHTRVMIDGQASSSCWGHDRYARSWLLPESISQLYHHSPTRHKVSMNSMDRHDVSMNSMDMHEVSTVLIDRLYTSSRTRDRSFEPSQPRYQIKVRIYSNTQPNLDTQPNTDSSSNKDAYEYVIPVLQGGICYRDKLNQSRILN